MSRNSSTICRDAERIPLVALRARSLSLRRSCGRGKTNPHPSFPSGKNGAAQRGAALIVALILLIVITLVGLAAIGTTIIQNKAASNQYDRQIAFQSAEAAMRVAAASVITDPGLVARNCQTGGTICQANPFTDATLPGGNIHTVTAGSSSDTTFTASAVAAMQPQFVVESLGSWNDPSNDLGCENSANSRNNNTGAPTGVGGCAPPAIYYRITARSCDPADSRCDNRAIVTLQSILKKG